MNTLEIILTIIGGFYALLLLAIIVQIMPMVIFDRKWYKAYCLVCSYNLWVREYLDKPDLEICPVEFIICTEYTNVWKTLFWSVWDFYTDEDVRNSIYRYYNSDNYIDIKEYIQYREERSKNENK